MNKEPRALRGGGLRIPTGKRRPAWGACPGRREGFRGHPAAAPRTPAGGPGQGIQPAPRPQRVHTRPRVGGPLAPRACERANGLCSLCPNTGWQPTPTPSPPAWVPQGKGAGRPGLQADSRGEGSAGVLEAQEARPARPAALTASAARPGGFPPPPLPPPSRPPGSPARPWPGCCCRRRPAGPSRGRAGSDGRPGAGRGGACGLDVAGGRGPRPRCLQIAGHRRGMGDTQPPGTGGETEAGGA